MISLNELSLRIHSVSVFRDLLDDPVIKALVDYLDLSEDVAVDDKIEAYAKFVHSIYATGGENLSRYVQKIINESDNIYVRNIGCGKVPSEVLGRSCREDLKTFGEISALTPEILGKEIDYTGFLPQWTTEETDIEKDYIKRTDSIGKYGYGIYAKHKMFYIDENRAIVPVCHPDPISLGDLIDYEREKKIILDNTKSLLLGNTASNVLLTGDAGTGKSSTIKAIVNELYDEGLRLIEVRKEQLNIIPRILDELTVNPLKFIIFIDDLSFARDDDNFSSLKAILEGSVSAKSKNVVIYATSNRRHLVKEKFSDREGDDVHFNDTMQEILSLSERFGIQITFQRPDKATYLKIVHSLAEKRNVEYNPEKLDVEAESFALRRGTRSARAAKQFVDRIASGNWNGI